MYHEFPQKTLSSTRVSTRIINQFIRMISEGSCDTEDWSNDAENSSLRQKLFHNITVYIYIYVTIVMVKSDLKNVSW